MKQLLLKFLKTEPMLYYLYLKNSIRKVRAKKIIRKYLDTIKKPKLTIGCGHNILEGWLNTDLYPRKSEFGAVAFLDASTKFPFGDNTFDYIYSEHIFEHLNFAHSCNMLAECYRVLKPNGVMRLAIPHAGFLFDLYQNPESPIHKAYIGFTMEHFCQDIAKVLGQNEFSYVYTVNNFYRDWGHEVLHNFDSLKHLIAHHDFSHIQKKEVGQSDIDDFKELERKGRLIYPKEFFDLETLVVEAKK